MLLLIIGLLLISPSSNAFQLSQAIGLSTLILSTAEAFRRPEAFSIAAILDSGSDRYNKLMLINAVKSVNSLRDLLPGVTLVPDIRFIPPGNTFEAEKVTCQILSKGVVAILGPQDKVNSEHIRSICDNSEVPFIESRRLPVPFHDGRGGKQARYRATNLHPDSETIGQVMVKIIRRYGWKNVTILYEDSEYLNLVQPILLETSKSLNTSLNNFRVILHELVKYGDEEYREGLKNVADSGSQHLVLACDHRILEDVLNQAQQVGLVTQDHSWFLASLDAHTVDLSQFKWDNTNFTMMRIVNFDRVVVQQILRGVVREEMSMGRSLGSDFQGDLSTDAALIYDAVHLFAGALTSLMEIQGDTHPQPLQCNSDDRQFWSHGSSLYNLMKITKFPGLTGTVSFDNGGRRTDFSLEILSLFEQGVVKVGAWEPGAGINISGVVTDGNLDSMPDNPMMNKTLVVTCVIQAPYTMHNESIVAQQGNKRYEGLVPDFVKRLAKLLNFNYKLRLVEDGNWGGEESPGKWNGMIGEVLDGRADMAIADLSITSSRVKAVEFSIPWMTLGISIIYKKPTKAPPGLLSFTEPFHPGVWGALVLGFVIVALMTYVLGRFSPYEWFNPNFCIMEPEELETQWDMSSSVFHTMGALMQQGTDFAPLSLSLRFLVGIFYFATVVLISSYTANLAASLTAENLDKKFESATQLSEQTEIQYGVVKGGSTMGFFRDSTFVTYQRMWEFMDKRSDVVMVNNNEAGIKKVIEDNGKYAFMMESAAIEYIQERECSLAQVGGLLDSKGYGVATRHGSGFKNKLDFAIIKMQEDGDFHRLKNKWWKQKRGGGRCKGGKGGSPANALKLDNVAGVFVATMCFCAIACCACIAEFLYGTYHQAEELGTPWMMEIRDGLAFSMKIYQNRRIDPLFLKRKERESRKSSSESSSESSPASTNRRKKSFHIHYPGW